MKFKKKLFRTGTRLQPRYMGLKPVPVLPISTRKLVKVKRFKKNVRTIVSNQLKKKIERKFVQQTHSTTVAANAGLTITTMDISPDIAQGLTGTTRIGNQVNITQWKVKCTIAFSTLTASSHRIIIAQPKLHANIADMDAAMLQLFPNTATPENLTRFSKPNNAFTTLFDSGHKVTAGTDASETVRKYFFNLPRKKLIFQGDAVTTITERRPIMYFIYFNVANTCLFNYTEMAHFQDA